MKRIVPISVSIALSLTMSAGLAAALSGDTVKKNPSLEVASGLQARAQIAVTMRPAPRAAQSWGSFKAHVGSGWQALWDADTGVPHRIYGTGMQVPGSVESARVAENYAWQFLARHIDLLAPGGRVGDFTMVSNHLDHHGMRTIGMIQTYRGLEVIGGQVNFRFKKDRLFVIGSDALPYVRVPELLHSMDQSVARDNAAQWVKSGAAKVAAREVEGPFILPIISHGAVTYHTVLRVAVDAEKPLGVWQVYVDAATGDEVARKQTLLFANGTVSYNVPARHPLGSRRTELARNTSLVVDDAAVVSDGDGVVTWNGEQPTTVATSVSSPLVALTNRAGDEATTSLSLAPDGDAVWNESSNEFVDAQLTTYIHGHLVKEYARRFAPDLGFLDEQLEARVNIDDNCNAFSDGRTINFFRKDDRCQNTGRLADVVYHEFGHSLHAQSIIQGVGAFDGAFSEGLSDYLASTITGDPRMGLGFFLGVAAVDSPLRHIDPLDEEKRWPDDVSESIHSTGLIFAGAMWDLRKALIASAEFEGDEDGAIRLADDLFYAAVQRASSIPSTYVEVLAADDDDGDLSNGTPHECLININFGRRHGLRDLLADFSPIGAQTPEAADYSLDFGISGLTDRCPGDNIVSAELQWGLRKASNGTPNVVALQGAGTGIDRTFTGTIPKQDLGTTVRYRFVVKLADGGEWTFPTNLADPAYEFYVGDVVELYCTDFDSDPFAEGWAHDLVKGEAGDDDWQWGMPMVAAGSVDPPVPFSGSYVLGNSLGGAAVEEASGQYPNQTTSFVTLPAVDLSTSDGNIYSDVRLHYRRWLTVEDARFDQATIYVDSREVWQNLRTQAGGTHHIDTGWVFHDVSLSPEVRDRNIQIKFELATDEGLEFGGWTIDDLCVVARADSICGDGQLTGIEQCDDGSGNSDTESNACRATCRAAFCGDGVVDDGEDCDNGGELDDVCNLQCGYLSGKEPSGCGCTVGDNDTPTAPLFLLFGFLALVTRQRMRAARASERRGR